MAKARKIDKARAECLALVAMVDKIAACKEKASMTSNAIDKLFWEGLAVQYQEAYDFLMGSHDEIGASRLAMQETEV